MSKRSNFLDEIKNLSFKELVQKLHFLKKELFNLRLKKVVDEIINTNIISNLKKNIARINTKINILKK